MKKNQLAGYVLIAPAYILFILFFIIPLIYSFALTFVEWNGFSTEQTFVGLSNYIELFSSEDFRNALVNTVVYSVSTTVLSTSISLVISAVIYKGIKGYSVIKGVYFLPHIVSMVAIGIVWSWIFQPGEGGLFNSILGLIGVEPLAWLQSPDYAMISLIIIGVWKSLGYNMIIIIAGILAISPSLYEASGIDGANPVQQFFRITLPLLKPTMFFVIVSSTTASLFQVFDIINVTTKGGPVGSTEMLVTYLYKAGFDEYRIGYASAIAFVLFAMAIGVTVVQKMIMDKE